MTVIRPFLKVSAVLMTTALLVMPVASAQEVAVSPTVSVVEDQARISITTTSLPRFVDRDRLKVEATFNGSATPTVVRDVLSKTVTPRREPVLLVLDVSGSMGVEGITETREAIGILVAELPPDVPLGLLVFNDTPSLLVAPTTERAEVVRFSESLAAGGNTALHDAISLGLTKLGRTGRLVVLSDGEDTSSTATRNELVRSIALSTVSVDLVTYNVGEQGQQAYSDLVAAAGERGSITGVESAADLAETLAATVNAVETTVMLSATVPTDLIGRQALDVRVTYGEVTLTGSTSVDIDAKAEAVVLPVLDGLSLPLILGAFLLALGVLIFIPSLMGRRRAVNESLAQIRHYSPEEVSAGEGALTMELIRSLLVRTGRRDSLAATLDGAGMRFSPEIWVLIRIAAPFVATTVLLVITGPAAAIVMGVAAGLYLPRFVVMFRRNRARRSFEAGLPDVLTLVAGSLRVGFSLDQAIAGAAEDREDVVGSELRRAMREMHVGSSLPEVLNRVADRMDSKDFRWVVTTLTIQRRTGASLSELLEGSARTMRERTQLKRDVKALTGEGRLSAWILGGLPFFIFAFLFLIRREYVEPLWATPMGLMLVAVGGIALGIGALWMRVLIKVEV